MWELIDVFIAVGLAAFGAVAIGALLCLDARNAGRLNSSKERAYGAPGATERGARPHLGRDPKHGEG
jgi:hypothetical protein